MKAILCSLMVIFATMSAFAQQSKSKDIEWSFDYGFTAMEQVTSINDLLDSLGYTDIDRWSLGMSLLSPYMGVNLHYDDWTFGTAYQGKHRYDVDVTLYSTPIIDRIHSSISWWSVHGERRFKTKGSAHSYVAAGISHATLDGYVKISGVEARSRIEDTDPFFRFGVYHEFKKAQLRVDYTRRFTDNEDAANIIRWTLRYPLGS